MILLEVRYKQFGNVYTVKLGYNDLRYNEHLVIMNILNLSVEMLDAAQAAVQVSKL